MNVHEFGSGSVDVVIAPGGPGLVEEFYRELIAALAEQYRVSVAVFSGTHPEPEDTFPRDIAAAADELEQAISQRSQSGRKTILLGHSYGGAVAIEALLRDPPVAGAILMSSFPSGDFLAQGIANRVANLPESFHQRVKDGAADDAESLAALIAEYWFPRHLCTVELPDSFQTGLGQLNPRFMNHVLGPNLLNPSGVILEWNREADLNSIATPVLVLGGPDDYFASDAVRRVFSHLPDVRFSFPTGASHS
ncbi:MAG TPA: alpha/beta hydrolase, partial [Alkalispirochaeta sp.]|nr:alpha/beta hydrolase [Alkalispirochaeta sp.]